MFDSSAPPPFNSSSLYDMDSVTSSRFRHSSPPPPPGGLLSALSMSTSLGLSCLSAGPSPSASLVVVNSADHTTAS